MSKLPIEALYGTKKHDGTYIGRIIVKQVPMQSNVFGFKIPEVDQKRDRPEMGEVVMVSEDVKHLVEGDIVLHSRFVGAKFEHNGQEYLVINADEAYAKWVK